MLDYKVKHGLGSMGLHACLRTTDLHSEPGTTCMFTNNKLALGAWDYVHVQEQQTLAGNLGLGACLGTNVGDRLTSNNLIMKKTKQSIN